MVGVNSSLPAIKLRPNAFPKKHSATCCGEASYYNKGTAWTVLLGKSQQMVPWDLLVPNICELGALQSRSKQIALTCSFIALKLASLQLHTTECFPTHQRIISPSLKNKEYILKCWILCWYFQLGYRGTCSSLAEEINPAPSRAEFCYKLHCNNKEVQPLDVFFVFSY